MALKTQHLIKGNWFSRRVYIKETKLLGVNLGLSHKEKII
jgi:hypothetical protein